MALKGLKQSILVCLGWCNKIPKTGQIMSNRNLFHTILELEVQDQGTGRFCVWWIFASGSQTAIFLLYRLGMEGARELCLFSSFQFSSVAQSCPTLCNPMGCSTPGLPDHHQLLKPTQFMSIELVMPSSHLILCRPLLLLPSIFPSIRVCLL